MKVINRQQTEEITINRSVSHVVEVNGKRYTRYEKIKIYVPRMDCEIITDKPTVKWSVYVALNVVGDVTKKEVKELGLEEAFSNLDLDSLNGNNY